MIILTGRRPNDSHLLLVVQGRVQVNTEVLTELLSFYNKRSVYISAKPEVYPEIIHAVCHDRENGC